MTERIGRPDTDDFIKARLDSYTSLVEHGDKWVGSEAIFHYTPKGGGRKEIQGKIIYSSKARTIVWNSETGALDYVDTNHGRIEEAWLKRTKTRWTRFEYFGLETLDQFKRKDIFGVIYGYSREHGQIVIDGDLDVVTKNSMDILRLRNGGTTHLIDPRYLQFRILFTEKKDALDFPPVGRDKPILLIDPFPKERSSLAEKLLTDMAGRGIGIYENKALYDFFEAHEAETRLLLKRYFDDEGQEMINIFQKRGIQKYLPLLIDPGIASRYKTFADFLTRFKSKNPDFLGARKAFSEKLGIATVYRGMALTEQEFDEISANGLYSPGLRNRSIATQALRDTLDPRAERVIGYGISFRDEIYTRMTDVRRSTVSMALSVSHYPEVASSIGWYDSRRTNKKGVRPYLFEIKTPLISLVEISGLFSYSRAIPTIEIQGKKYFFNSGKVEALVPYFIPKNAFKGQKTSVPPRWKNIS